MSLSHPLQGVIPPVITPLTGTGGLDEPVFGALLDRLIDAGVDALFVGGTAGLGPLLTDREWNRMMEFAIEHVGERLPMLAGVMETSTPRAKERLGRLESIGYRYFVLTPTFYCVPHEADEFLRHFGDCAEATSMEMIIYNIPPCTGSSIPIGTVLEMTRRGWSQTCKESSGDPGYFKKLSVEGAPLGLKVFQGNRPELAWLRECGAAGIVPVPANVNPGLLVHAWSVACEGGDVEALQREINDSWHALVRGFNFLGGSVYALSRISLGTGYMLLPLQSPDADWRHLIDTYLSSKAISHSGDPNTRGDSR